MIRKVLHYILSLVLILFFLVAGTGYNAVHYCCDTCRAAGIEHVAEESCEAIHHHEHHHHDGHCHHQNSCWLRHLQVNDFAQSAEIQVPAAHEMLLPAPADFFSPAVLLPLLELEYATVNPPPLSSGGTDILVDVCRWIC
ncbi:MAG: hypothetical protein KBS77_00110 [Bacteroidales bacterium]|nr:hypothetical protein [Candidatus Colicola faecequi]